MAFNYTYTRDGMAIAFRFALQDRKMQGCVMTFEGDDIPDDMVTRVFALRKMIVDVTSQRPVTWPFTPSDDERSDAEFVLEIAAACTYEHMHALIHTLRPCVDMRKRILAKYHQPALMVLHPYESTYESHGCALRVVVRDGEVPTCDTMIVGTDPKGLRECVSVATAVHKCVTGGYRGQTDFVCQIDKYLHDGESLRAKRNMTFHIEMKGCVGTLDATEQFGKYTANASASVVGVPSAMMLIFDAILRGDNVTAIISQNMREWYSVADFVKSPSCAKMRMYVCSVWWGTSEYTIAIDRETLEPENSAHAQICYDIRSCDKVLQSQSISAALLHIWLCKPTTNPFMTKVSLRQYEDTIMNRNKW